MKERGSLNLELALLVALLVIAAVGTLSFMGLGISNQFTKGGNRVAGGPGVVGGGMTPVLAADSDFTWREFSPGSGTWVVVSYVGAGGYVQIPDTHLGGPVVEIGSYAFQNNADLTGIVIPDTVTAITSGAFRNCTNLTKINLPSGLVTIGGVAFDGDAGLAAEFPNIPASVTGINASSFRGTGIIPVLAAGNTKYSVDAQNVLYEKVNPFKIIYAPSSLSGDYVAPDTVVGINSNSFYGCTGLKSVTLNNATIANTGISPSSFVNCPQLEAINVPASTATHSDNGVVITVNGAIHSLLIYPEGKMDVAYTVPSEVTVIGIISNLSVFRFNTHLKTLNINKETNNIIGNIFADASIDTVNLEVGTTLSWDPTSGNKVLLRADSAPISCMTSFIGTYTLPAAATSVNQGAFASCTGLTGLDFSNVNGVMTSINSGAFYGCTGLTGNIYLPHSVAIISSNAFSGCTNPNLYLHVSNNPAGLDTNPTSPANVAGRYDGVVNPVVADQ